MSMSALFADFSDEISAVRAPDAPNPDILDGYEAGYQAGWDDAVTSQKEARAHLGAALSNNLEQIEFTLVEAQTEILARLRPILEEISKTLLPDLSDKGLCSHLVKEVENLLRSANTQAVCLAVSAHDEEKVSELLKSLPDLSRVELVVKDTLGEGQSQITCSQVLKKTDLKQSIKDIQASIEGFLNQPKLEQLNAG